MSSQKKAWIVRGIVQGVGFRYFVLRNAGARGLSGWVRNCRDGSVEVAACGDPSQLEGFLMELRLGPPMAQVDRVDEMPIPAALEEGPPFTIL